MLEEAKAIDGRGIIGWKFLVINWYIQREWNSQTTREKYRFEPRVIDVE